MLFRKCWLSALFIFFLFQAPAQSLYHLVNDSPASGAENKFDALLIRQPNGNGLLRLIPSNGSNSVISFDVRETPYITPSGEPDTNFVKYPFQTATVLSGDENASYPSPVIWFKKAADGFFAPWGFSIASDQTPPAEANFTNSEFLNSETLMQDQLIRYFPNGDPVFQNMFGGTKRELSPAEKNVKVYMILVANSNDKIIGNACLNDVMSVEQTFRSAVRTLGVLMQVTRINGSDYNKQNVMNAVNALKPGPNDVVVFYYSGHGFRKTQDRRPFPYMDLRANESMDFNQESANLRDIYDILKQKGARLNLVVGDCCNTPPEVVNAEFESLPANKFSGLKLSPENCRQLLLGDDRSSWLMCAASPGEKAASNNILGGFFTNFFVNSLETALSVTTVNPDWQQVLRNAKEATVYTSAKTYCDKPHIPQNLCKQVPIFYPALTLN